MFALLKLSRQLQLNVRYQINIEYKNCSFKMYFHKSGYHGKKEICNFSSASSQNELEFNTLI